MLANTDCGLGCREQPTSIASPASTGRVIGSNSSAWPTMEACLRRIFGAKEMAYLSLRDALGQLALYASEDSPKYGKAGTRWRPTRARVRRLSLEDVQLAAAALDALPRRPDVAMKVLADLSR